MNPRMGRRLDAETRKAYLFGAFRARARLAGEEENTDVHDDVAYVRATGHRNT
jgi:hypothetical protein